MQVSSDQGPNVGRDEAHKADPNSAAIVLQMLLGRDDYTVTAEESLFGSTNPRGQRVMTLPIENVARHVRFNYDLRPGRTVSSSCQSCLVKPFSSLRILCYEGAVMAALPRGIHIDVQQRNDLATLPLQTKTHRKSLHFFAKNLPPFCRRITRVWFDELVEEAVAGCEALRLSASVAHRRKQT